MVVAKWFIHRFPKLAKLRPILRAIELIDLAISLWERVPKLIQLAGGLIMTVLLARLIQILAVVRSWLEPNWRGFLMVLIPGIFVFVLFLIRDIRKNRALRPIMNRASNQSRLNLVVRGQLGGNARIFDTPKGDNPLWTLQAPLYAGGLLWGINLLFVNKENQPVNIMATLAIPTRKEDPSKRYRVLPLSKPIYKYRDESILYFRPDHLGFPVYIEPGKYVNGHVEFAIEAFRFDNIIKSGSARQALFGHGEVLEVEDLLSGKKAEFKLY